MEWVSISLMKIAVGGSANNKATPSSLYIMVRGCSQIMSAAEEGRWVFKMLTMADKGGRGGKANADNG